MLVPQRVHLFDVLYHHRILTLPHHPHHLRRGNGKPESNTVAGSLQVSINAIYMFVHTRGRLLCWKQHQPMAKLVVISLGQGHLQVRAPPKKATNLNYQPHNKAPLRGSGSYYNKTINPKLNHQSNHFK